MSAKAGRREQDKKRRRTILIIVAAVDVLLLAALAVFLFYPREKPPEEAGEVVIGGRAAEQDFFDSSAREGSLPGRTQEELVAELNKIVEEGMFNISIASIILFEDAQSPGQARIENIAANPYHMSVVITLDETGEVLYQSKGIAPGQYIEYITLNKALSRGEHSATAVFTAHNQDDLSERGQAAAKITLVIEH